MKQRYNIRVFKQNMRQEAFKKNLNASKGMLQNTNLLKKENKNYRKTTRTNYTQARYTIHTYGALSNDEIFLRETLNLILQP